MESNSNIISAAISDRGLSEHRPQNEDSFLDLPQYGLFAVADGVGGTQGGDVASQTAMEILAEAFANYESSAKPDEIIKIAIERANEAIFQMAGDIPQLASMATTIAVLQISDSTATIAHVGDSRVYRLDKKSGIHRETLDHSVVEEEVRAGRMTPEQALNHPSRNVISRAVGAENTVDIDIKTVPIEPGSIYLICSDGVTRHLDDNELADLLLTGMSPGLLCEQVKELCYERGAEDNLTAVIVVTPTRVGGEIGVIDGVTEDEIELDTIATARPPFDRTIEEIPVDVPSDFDTVPETYETIEPYQVEEIISSTEVDSESVTSDEFLTDDPKLTTYDDEAYLQTEHVELESEASGEGYNSSSVVVESRQEPLEQELKIFGSTSRVHETPEVRAGSVASTIFTSLLWLVLGGALGVFGFYFWMQANQATQVGQQVEPTPITEMTSGNIPLTSFEESRREVDKDPSAYVNKRAATPQDAEDHYLLGRALLLTGRYFEAKRQFVLAKEKLEQAEPENKSTLAVEMAMANAIIENGPASEAFKKYIAPQPSPAPANVVSNTVVKTNQ